MKKIYWVFILMLGGMLAGCSALVAPVANSLSGPKGESCETQGTRGGLSYNYKWSSLSNPTGELIISGASQADSWDAPKSYQIGVKNGSFQELILAPGQPFSLNFSNVSKESNLCINQDCSFLSLCWF